MNKESKILDNVSMQNLKLGIPLMIGREVKIELLDIVDNYAKISVSTIKDNLIQREEVYRSMQKVRLIISNKNDTGK